ncbi:MAG: hypothetical protein KGI98_10775 [Euryarchaeota archaeon]|nr:hypothetical protein [Euryarchaeota archaeon]
MRRGVLAVGAVLVALGLLFTFVPLFVPSGGAQFGAAMVQSRTMLFEARYAFTWTGGGAADYVAAYGCGEKAPSTLNSSTGPSTVCGGQVLLAHASGASGTIACSVPNAQWVLVVAFTNASGSIDGAAKISATASQGLIGVPLLFLGAIFVALGAILSRRGPRPAPESTFFAPGPGAGSGPEEPLSEGPSRSKVSVKRS